ncbi:hypothetical protein V5O48_013201 [Marasmius crinis-equi]|uniref:Uncharacterized protein n=1 Tax=Marasmius crinis-equi TaxID=585013 RepID=A0ABR3F0S0_9AGAR
MVSFATGTTTTPPQRATQAIPRTPLATRYIPLGDRVTRGPVSYFPAENSQPSSQTSSTVGSQMPSSPTGAPSVHSRTDHDVDTQESATELTIERRDGLLVVATFQTFREELEEERLPRFSSKNTHNLDMKTSESHLIIKRQDGFVVTCRIVTKVDPSVASSETAPDSGIETTDPAVNVSPPGGDAGGITSVAQPELRDEPDELDLDDGDSLMIGPSDVESVNSLVIVNNEEDDYDPFSIPPIKPVPSALRRPANDRPHTKYYVVYAGLRVGIFRGDWNKVVEPYVSRVAHSNHKAYYSWDEALFNYASAYQGKHARFRVEILEEEELENPDAANYRFGDGRMIGRVDVTGLDLLPRNIPAVYRVVRNV